MAQITLDHVDKLYENGFHAVHDLSLTIDDGEFLVLVGPSGCGKSTALRMIAGLETISRGTLEIDGRVVNDVEPKDRDIAMVFQSYALYPHMTGAREHRLSVEVEQGAQARDQGARGRGGARARVDGVARPSSGAPLRWPAPAGRDGAGDRAPAEGLPDGRAALEPRRQAAGADPRRDLPTAAPARRDHGVRHPRPGGGDDDGRSCRGAVAGIAAAGRHAAEPVRPPGQPLRRDVHRLATDERAARHPDPGRRWRGADPAREPDHRRAGARRRLAAGTGRVRRPRSGGRHPAVGCRRSRRRRRRRVHAEGPCGGA